MGYHIASSLGDHECKALAVRLTSRYNLLHAPLAQLVRAFDSHSKGLRFEP